jgi:hypothetical protein
LTRIKEKKSVPRGWLSKKSSTQIRRFRKKPLARARLIHIPMHADNPILRTKITRIGLKVALISLFAIPVYAGGLGAIYTENFDGVRSPLLPEGWVASQGVNVAGAPLWVTSIVLPDTAANDAFSTAPGNILDNRLDTPVLPLTGASFALRFSHSYNLEAGRDGAVLEISSPDINGGAFTDITDPAAHASVSPGYNTLISSGFQSPIAGRMAWSGNSGGYILTSINFGPTLPSQPKLRFRLASDNSGASVGWQIDSFSVRITEGPSPTPTPPASPTPTPTPIPTPCDGSPNLLADSTFETGTPWPAWTVQTSTNFGTPLCDTATCGTGGTAPPYAGSNWAWFGGASAAETATLGQNVSIMAGGQATLSFEMRIGAMSFPLTDVLNVRVDGTIVQSYPEPGSAETAYSLRTIDLSAFADGGSHNILFEYVGSTTGSSSYAVDNITLTNIFGCPTPTPSPTVTPTATPTPTATVTVTPSPTIPLPSEPPCPSCPPSPTPSPTVPPPPTPSPSPTATPSPAPAQALNISTRLRVETGERVAIGGFIITGIEPKKVAIRGVGPSLSNSGLSDVLADPTLELRSSGGALLLQNDNWQDDPAQAAQLMALGLAPQNPNESGMVATLEPGVYTAILAGKNQTSGLALVEIYDADTAADSRLANISTRGFVRTGDSVMIGGFILGEGSASCDVAVRGIGPSLGQSGLTDVLADPTLELYDGNGTLLIANDNWPDDFVSAEQLAAHGLAPPNIVEAGIFITLPPGLFTAVLAGKNGGVGLGLVEVYSGLAGGTLTVTSTLDSGAGSLRDAIAAAVDGDTIQFDAALNGQPIALTSGELLIDKSITIRGPMVVERSPADGTPALRIFHITPGHAVTMEDLTIQFGFTTESGAGIFNDGSTLTLNHCAVTRNFGGLSGGASGGGIYSSGAGATLTIANSTITNNVLSVGEQFSGSGNGAGIFNNGTLAIDHSTVSGNSFYDFNPPRPQLGGDGGGIYSASGMLTISNSTISGNSANVIGGGVFNEGTSEITNSTISSNGALGSGGGISNGGTLTVDHSILQGNSAYFKWFGAGGAVSNHGTLEIRNSTLSGNRVDGGGGAIDNSGQTTIANSTLIDNFSLHTKTMGGGSLRNVDFGTMQIGNTIISSGSSDANFNNSGTVISHGYNLSSDDGGGLLTATGDQTDTAPMLGPLQDNGGPTFTHALLTGSPAINAGDPSFTPPPLYDQRGPGYDRVVNGRIDIGSFEVQP